MALRSLILTSREIRSLLRKNVNLTWIRSQPKSDLMPMGGGWGSLFKLQTIKDNWETIPIFVTAFIASSFPVLHSIFRLTHAEDLCFSPGSKMKCQKHRWILEGPPKPTLYMVRTQKWEWPQGLLDALREDGDKSGSSGSSGSDGAGGASGAPSKCDKPKKVSFRFWQKDGSRNDNYEEE